MWWTDFLTYSSGVRRWAADLTPSSVERRYCSVSSLKSQSVNWVWSLRASPDRKDWTSWACAGHAQDAGGAVAAVHPLRLVVDLPDQVIDAVAVGLGRGLAQEPGVDDLGEERAAFVRVAPDHVHHLVVAGVAERLGEGAVGERRAEDERVQLPPHVIAVRRQVLLLDAAGDALELLEQLVHAGDDRVRERPGHVLLQLQAVAAGRGADAQLHLLQPQAQVGEEGLHVRDDDLVFLADLVKFLPFGEEFLEFFPSFPFCAIAGLKSRSIHEPSSRVASQTTIWAVVTRLRTTARPE